MKPVRSAVGASLIMALTGFVGTAEAQLTPGATPGAFRGGSGQAAGSSAEQLGSELLRNRASDRGTALEPIWSFGVLNRLTLSDNIDLAPPGQEENGLLLEISPYVRAEVNRPRFQGLLSYSMRNFYTSPDVGYEGPNHDLSALGNVALKDDWLWLAGQALVNEVSISPFEITAADPSSRPSNRTRYSRYDISPYVRGWLGQRMLYEAGYAFHSIKYGGEDLSSTGHQLRARVQRDPVLRRFGWLVRADGGTREFDDGSDYQTTNALVAGLYRATNSVSLGAGASYNRISVISDESGDTGGWGPTVLLDWAPSPRTLLNLEATDAYYGNNAVARLSHRASNWTFLLQYDQGITDGSEAGLTYVDGRTRARPGQRQDQVNPINDQLQDRGTLADFGTPLASGLLGGALVENRRLAATAGWVRLRNSMAVTLFVNRSETQQTTEPLPGASDGLQDLDQRGVLLRYGRLISPRTTGFLQGRFTRSETAGGTVSSNLTVADAVLSHSLGEATAVSIGYRRSEQSGSAEYRENAILATLNLRF